MTREAETVVEALVVGGGISGIATSIRLRREAGLDDVLILEKADQLGGTWRENTYPGCACDIPSHLYSFEFAPNPDWSRVFAERAEIQEYVLRVAGEQGVPERTVFGCEVLEAVWDEPAGLWRLTTTKGAFAAPIMVFAPGPLHEPKLPAVPGLETFRGTTFHSARWDHRHDLTGERVAVIGTGPSAIQFVPEIAGRVSALTVLQRSPAWVLPKPDWRITRPERALYRRFPALLRWMRSAQWAGCDWMLTQYADHRLVRRRMNWIGRLHLLATIRDRRLRAQLTPDWALGCKRMLLSNSWYPTLRRPHVRLVPHEIREVRERSVVAADGSEHRVDTIIWATGFHVSDLPFTDRVRGRDGRTLAEVWGDNPSAYFGTSISGFPNAFMLFGPNIGTVSAFPMLEGQLNHVTRAVRTWRERGASGIEVTAEAQREYKRQANARLARSTWNAGGCTSYYLDRSGENYSVYPGTMRELVAQGADFRAEHYHLHAGHDRIAAG